MMKKGDEWSGPHICTQIHTFAHIYARFYAEITTNQP